MCYSNLNILLCASKVCFTILECSLSLAISQMKFLKFLSKVILIHLFWISVRPGHSSGASGLLQFTSGLILYWLKQTRKRNTHLSSMWYIFELPSTHRRLPWLIHHLDKIQNKEKTRVSLGLNLYCHFESANSRIWQKGKIIFIFHVCFLRRGNSETTLNILSCYKNERKLCLTLSILSTSLLRRISLVQS